MDKRIYVFIAVILSLALLVLFANNYLEIYSYKSYKPPSREVLNNRYFALEQWLKETGHSVRIEQMYNPEKIAAAPESVVIVHAAACDWENPEEVIAPWIERGNSLIIILDNYYTDQLDENLLSSMSDLGIDLTYGIPENYPREESVPDYNLNIGFLHDDKADMFIRKDTLDITRIIEFSFGEGKLIFTGTPSFMFNNNLEREPNARLSWELTGGLTTENNKGILFVRTGGRYISQSMFGKIMDRGNLVPVIISAALVIFLGFWMVIPAFGLVFYEKQKSSRPIKERFAAEISFLKKHRGLNYYLEIYERELQHGAVNKEEKYNYGEIINNLRSVYNETDKLKRGISSIKT